MYNRSSIRQTLFEQDAAVKVLQIFTAVNKPGFGRSTWFIVAIAAGTKMWMAIRIC